MTPQERAEDLVLKYLRIDNNTKEWFNTHIAKQCALIAVDEILDLSQIASFRRDNVYMEMEYWGEVIKEINNL